MNSGKAKRQGCIKGESIPEATPKTAGNRIYCILEIWKDWFINIDLYCERLSPGLWAEPVNALSNVAFFLAAIWGWYTASKNRKLDGQIKLLCILAASIGLGSLLFHTHANLWSSFADVIPIWSFVAIYIVISVTLLTGKSHLRVGGITAGVLAVIIAIVWVTSQGSATQTEASTDLLNGSGQYTPALIALWVFALITIRRNLVIQKWIVSAAVIFSLSLVLRTIDLHLCSVIPVGTHFLWHTLNGLMVALLLQGIIRLKIHQNPG